MPGKLIGFFFPNGCQGHPQGQGGEGSRQEHRVRFLPALFASSRRRCPRDRFLMFSRPRVPRPAAYFANDRDQAEAHRQKAKAARERRRTRITEKRETALAEYSAKADEAAPVALPSKAEKKDTAPASVSEKERKKNKK
ncbi:MAG: hypothetical protein BJ554DRAFT_1401 [Olpidium bornovanus]|uniref:Uncharacterized protein n=1 Tax=Olpidium bornovanus TaxID=278681 RepID=A0A8H8DHG2_9FUNG|nr:MAG: hypothetical protein BJ554DRAFT_1401 [Olpidium bornovanus]